MTLIDDNDVYRDRVQRGYDYFVICDGVLYYDTDCSKYLNLETGQKGTIEQNGVDDKLIKSSEWRYDNNEGVWYHMSNGGITKLVDGAEETVYLAKTDEHLDSLVSMATDALYFQSYEYTDYYISDYSQKGPNYDYSKEINLSLYKLDLNTEEVTKIDSRITGLGEFRADY